MTVGELASILKQLPPSHPVRFYYDSGHEHLLINGVFLVSPTEDINDYPHHVLLSGEDSEDAYEDLVEVGWKVNVPLLVI